MSHSRNMKHVLLDSNFIISCLRQKLDFFEQIPLLGFEILIPKQVIKEIEKLSKTKSSAVLREESDLCLKLLSRSKFTLVKLKYNQVDKGIIGFANENEDVIIATLDKELKNKIRNRKMIIRNRKKLEIV